MVLEDIPYGNLTIFVININLSQFIICKTGPCMINITENIKLIFHFYENILKGYCI